MKRSIVVPHANCVIQNAVKARFSRDGLHRYSLLIPLHDRDNCRILRIVGQNPSAADEQIADKTINYLENFVYRNLPEYGAIEMLNLYTRVDKDKIEIDVLDGSSDTEFKNSVSPGSDTLLVFGRLKNERAYKFKSRAQQLRPILELANLYKIDIGADYAPHPGNPAIVYSRLDLKILKFTLYHSQAR